jgi:ribulose-5-phosphate 4-epimerase/fuculose-1-phosphate aldolase
MTMTSTATGEAPARAHISDEERQVRIDLAAAYRLVAHYGWDDMIFTHLSARVPGTEYFLINPYGVVFSQIDASGLVKIDLDGNVVDQPGAIVNAAGFTIHSAVHASRHDAACVMHLHTVAGTAVATNRRGLLPLNQTAMLVCRDVAYHDYEGLAFDLAERPRLVADLGDKPLMLLRNHGTLALGPSVASAFLQIYLLERACAMQVATLAGGAEPIVPGEAVQELVQKQAHAGGDSVAKLAWSALVRMLDAKDTSYRN